MANYLENLPNELIEVIYEKKHRAEFKSSLEGVKKFEFPCMLEITQPYVGSIYLIEGRGRLMLYRYSTFSHHYFCRLSSEDEVIKVSRRSKSKIYLFGHPPSPYVEAVRD